MTCKKCGLKLKKSDKFCPRCGEIVPKQKKSTAKKVVVVIASFLAVVAVCGVVSVALNNSNSSPKVYKNTSRSFDGNYKSNVKKNLNTSESETEAEKGIITGQVLDDSGNPIENAEVCAIVVREAETKDNAENVSDTSGNDSEIKTKTDKEGKYSIECLVGEYKIQITADGYDGFISEKYVTVSTGKTVSIEKINLKSKSSEFDSLITNVINNEATWIDDLSQEDESYSIWDKGKNICGNDYLWFQDMDMDGTLEFITMSKYVDDQDLRYDNRFCSVYECNDASFDCYPQSNCDIPSTIRFGSTNITDNIFDYSLWQMKDGSYMYLTNGTSDDTLIDIIYLCLTGGGSKNYPLLQIYNNTEGYINWTDYFSTEFATKVSLADAKKYYDDYFDGAVSYKTNTKKIKLSDYQNKTEDEKRKLFE